MTLKDYDETPKYGVLCRKSGNDYAFFDDMYRFVLFKCNARLRFFHYVPTGFTPHIGDALVKMTFDNPDFVLQAQVRQAVADWGWMEAGMEKDRRIGEHILNPYESLLASYNPNNYLHFFSKVYEAAVTLFGIGKLHLMRQVFYYAMNTMLKYFLFHPTHPRLEESAREILGLSYLP